MGEYVVLTAAIYCTSEYAFSGVDDNMHTALNVLLFMVAIAYAVWREKIDVKGLVRAAIGKFKR